MPELQNHPQPPELSYTKKVWIAAGIVALVVAILLLFKTLFNAVLLIFVGVLIAIFFHGFAGLLQRFLLLPQKWSVVISVLFNIGLLVGFFWFAGSRLSQQISQLSDTLPKTFQDAKEQVSQTPAGRQLIQYAESSGSSSKTQSTLRQFFSSTFGVISDLYIVLLIGLFFTASPTLYIKGIVHLLPPKAKDRGDELIRKLGYQLKEWLKGQIIGVVFIGVLSAVALIILGIPLVFTLALLAGLMNFIPNFGPIIALIPAVLLGLTQGTSTAMYVAIIYTGIQALQTALFKPLITKKMVSVPPALTVIGQITMGALGGFWGVLLATPTVLVIMTFVNGLYVKNQDYHKYEFEETKGPDDKNK